MDIVSYILSKKYTDLTVDGLGAIKGAPCTVQSIVDITDGKRVTLAWESNSGVEQTQSFDIMDGEDGANTVEWSQIQQSGTKIAEININGVSQDVYVPQGGGSGGHTIYDKGGTALAQESGLQFTGAVSVSDDSVNGRTVIDVEGGGNYYLNTIYSTEEKKVGYWTDGKPLYQKTWDFGSDLIINSNTWTDTSIRVSDFNIENIIHASALNSNGSFYGFVSTNRDQTYVQILQTRNSQITVRYFTLRYTKTTDTPELNPQFGNVIYLPTIYSEEEREVGCWADGKPLYQRILTLTQDIDLVMDSWVKTEFNKDTMETLVRVDVTAGISGTIIEALSGSFIDGKLALNSARTLGLHVSDNVRLIVQYTKTTDTAGSGDWTPSGAKAVHYSTNEQVIGTWIDGKTLYETTFTGLSIALNDTAWIQFDGVSVDTIVKFDAYTWNSTQWLHCAISEYQRQANTGGIQFAGFSGFNRTVNMIVAQYTKTTD